MKKLLLLLIVCCSIGVAHSQNLMPISTINSYYYFNHSYRLSNTIAAPKYAFAEFTSDSLSIFMDDTTAIFYTNVKITSYKYNNGQKVWLGTVRDEYGVLVKIRLEMMIETPVLLSTYSNNIKTEYKLKSLF